MQLQPLKWWRYNMLSSFLSSESGLLAGGAITGDLTISGDLTVSGDGGYAYSEVLTGDMKITNTAATIGLEIVQSGDNYALKIDQDDADKPALFIDAETTTNRSIDLRADALTTGVGAFFYSSSADDGAYKLVEIKNDGASAPGATALSVLNNSTGKVLFVDHNTSGVGASNATAVHIDYDRTVASSGTAAHNDIGIDLDVNSASLGTSSFIGMDIDVVGATSGTSRAIGLTVDVSGADSNYAALFNAGNVGIGTTAPATLVEIQGGLTTTGAVLTLSTKEPSVVANDVLGKINFQAPLDTGLDSDLVGASISAMAEATFSDTVNSTALIFSTNTTATATERMRINSAGNVGIGEGAGLYFDGIDDTYIASTADDILKFYTNAAARLVLDTNSRISLSNNDSSGAIGVTLLGYQAGDVIASGHINNTMIGHMAGWRTTEANNTYVGFSAGKGASGADANNVGVGASALFAVTTGGNNVAIGKDSLHGILGGSSNIAIGKDSLYYGSAAANNVSVGNGAMVGNFGTNAVNDCVAIGSSSLIGVLTAAASGSVAIGKSALAANTDGAKNIAIGYNSMLLATTATNNVAIGYDAMNAMVGDEANKNDGHHNIAIGTDAMGSVNAYTHTSSLSDGNIAIGTNALLGGVFADSALYLVGNIAIGYNALDGTGTNGAGTTGNVAIGYEALTAHTGAGSGNNTAIGYKSMLTATTAQNNVMIGWKTGYQMRIGAAYCTVLGSQAFSGAHDTSDSDGCTAIGYLALSGALNDADYNTMVGYQAGDGITTGRTNTGIGADVAFDIDANNQTCVGYQATTDSANDIAIGNTSVDEVKGQVDFTTFSDERIKTDVKDGDLGLDFIKLLKPKKFKKVNPAKYPDSIRKPQDGVNNKGVEHEWTDAQANKVWDGLIAQEVKSAIDACNTTFSGWSEESNSKQLVGYSTLVMPLIKAIQELSAQVEELKNK